MRRSRTVISGLALLSLAATPPAIAGAEIPTPAHVFGFEPGADRQLIDYEQLIAYLRELDAASPRLELRQVGRSPLGRPMFVLFLSAPENIARLDELRNLNERLALDPAIPANELDTLVRDGRVFLMATLSMHSREVGPSQALPLFVHQMVTTEDPSTLEHLRKVVFLIVPSHNPDGMDMIVEYYRKKKGTPYEGASMPGLYHRYVGHDNNRDFIILTQQDTRVINRLYSTEWFPHVLVEKHEMGGDGPRYFVPENHDPIAENIDEDLWNWSKVFGSNLSRDMASDGLRGVVSHWLFDNYWPGSTETSLWKNVISFLTEAASCKVAKPVYVEPGELHVDGMGLAEYKKSVNMPDPWPGGWWRLGDIVRYELSSLRSMLKTAALYHDEILRARNELCRQAVAAGRETPPYYYVLPREQHDRSALPALVALLLEHGVRVYALSERTVVSSTLLEPGTVVVPLSQPYRAFVKEVMERQVYPARRYVPGGDVIRPYDITSWSLPLHFGLRVFEIGTRSPELESRLLPVTKDLQPAVVLPERVWGLGYPVADNAAFLAAFGALERKLQVARIEEPLNTSDPRLPRGSFVITGDRSSLGALATLAGVAPAVLTEEPKTALAPLTRPRIALVETWFHDMDAGWARYLLDTYHIQYSVLRPDGLEKAELDRRYDVVIFPDADKHILTRGRYKREDAYEINDFPPEYRRPIGREGFRKLIDFVEQGGILVAWRRSATVFMNDAEVERQKDEKEPLQLPVTDISEEREKRGLFVPGSLLRIRIVPDHPLTWGMPEEIGVFSRGTPVLATRVPQLDMDRRVVASYTQEAKDLLLSGYAEGEEHLAGTPAAIWVRRGKGQLVFFAFNPQFRAATPSTYKLLFNALLLRR